MSTITVDGLLAEARAFLDANCRARNASDEAFVWGVGSDRVNILEEVEASRASAQLAEAKAYAARRFDAGFGWIDGPVEYGGRGLTAAHATAYQELEARYEIPNLSMLTIAVGFIGPALLAHASADLRAAYLRKLYRGDLVMCQLFSEPNAGSDLASARTRGVRDGDEWVVNGQKVWTSSAQIADLGLAVCRTDPDVPKHQGLTTFLVDMRAPGVEVRPLRQMTGSANFNEVFLTDVRVPDSHRVGDVNGGFRVILTTLGNERTIATRAPSSGRGIEPFERLVGVVDTFGDRSDARQRQRLAQLYIGDRVKHFLVERWRASLRPGVTPGPEMSVLKLHSCRHNAELVGMLTEVLGPRLAADAGEWGSFAWNEYVLSTPGARIGGGTEEIVRNTVGEKVLGLPKEPRA
ncbi:MAG TPA: acyl-CoA dehydrogenase family protein [Acidimicrobiia bacterium]|nr:acyl-CoA dehydrogenase family protein [Acidimicrobiia bacterium]